MTIEEAQTKAEGQLTRAGIRTARLDSLVLLEKASGVKREWLLAHPERTMSTESKNKFFTLIKQRSNRVPLPQITGKQEFWGLAFKVNTHTLIPRPESESIVEYALEFAGNNVKVLDVGTGCGCIAIAIAKEKPNWDVSASDVSTKALKVAKANAKMHGVNINFFKSDVLADVKDKFSIITANLPYLRISHKQHLTEEATREPAIALFGGTDGLDLYRRFFAKITDVSKPNGLVIIEADPWQHEKLIGLAETMGLELKNQDRFVLCFQS